MEDVRLPDLEVIKKFSIAVRREHAPADEVIAALRADLARIAGHARTPMGPPDEPPPRARKSAARAKLLARAKPAPAATRKKPKRR